MDKVSTMILEKITDKTKQLIGEKLDRIILYGSYARGDNDLSSDLDIMILVDADENEIATFDYEFNDLILELSLEYDIVISVFIKNKTQFQQYSAILPFYINVLREGIKIYG